MKDLFEFIMLGLCAIGGFLGIIFMGVVLCVMAYFPFIIALTAVGIISSLLGVL